MNGTEGPAFPGPDADSAVREEQLLPISAVAEILYCPRNFWYRTADRSDDMNAHTVRGSLAAEARNTRATQTAGGIRQRREVEVTSLRLGITGRVDVVEESGRVVPVEYKTGRDRRGRWEEVQLAAYAVALEETLDTTVSAGYLYHSASGRRRRVEMTPELREVVERTSARAREILAAGVAPEGVRDARCPGCALFARCMPWLDRDQRVPANPAQVLSERWEGESLIVDRPGAYLRREGELLVVTADGGRLAEVSVHKVSSVSLVGAANASSAAIRLAWDEGIVVHHLSRGGTYLGAYLPATARGLAVRRRQYRLADEPGYVLTLSRSIVTGKLRNQRSLLLRWSRENTGRGAAAELRTRARVIAALDPAIARATDVDAVRGAEGAGAKEYFAGIRARVSTLDLGVAPKFEHRARRPPPDPINAALSFGYALLLKDCVSACVVAGLDPYVGFLHGEAWNRPSLALDLSEEFRPVLVDRLVVALFQRRSLQPAAHFQEVPGGWHLNDAGREVMYGAYEAQRRQEVQHPVFGFSVTYRRCIEMQARLLARYLSGDDQEYRPFAMRG